MPVTSRRSWSSASCSRARPGPRRRLPPPSPGSQARYAMNGLPTGTVKARLVADLEVRVITEDGELLRGLSLDPTRDDQPLG